MCVCCFIYPRVSCEVSTVCVFLYWSSITCKCVLAVVLSEVWVTGPARERKTVLLRLKTTQPFFGLCVCVQYTSVCASEARSVMLACVFNKRLCRSVCVKVDVPQPKVFRRFTDPLTFRLIVVPCVFTCAHVGRFFFYFSGHLTHISLGIPTFPCSGKLRGWNTLLSLSVASMLPEHSDNGGWLCRVEKSPREKSIRLFSSVRMSKLIDWLLNLWSELTVGYWSFHFELFVCRNFCFRILRTRCSEKVSKKKLWRGISSLIFKLCVECQVKTC